MVKRQRLASRVFASAWLILALTATAHGAGYEDFFGSYSGHAGNNGKARVIHVDIKETKKGFNVSWETETESASGKAKTKDYSIDFEPSERDNIYSSAMKTNVFGGRVPLDPLKGDPFVWARIDGNVMTVYAMLITDEGGYEMQTYVRTLTDKGLELEFSRVRDGQPMKSISGLLERDGGSPDRNK